MRKLTLDETWKRCMAMWRWIVAQRKARSPLTVDELKGEWIQRFGGQADVDGDCYLVSKRFSCGNRTYHYASKPIKFAAKLESLYKQYKKQKKGRKTHAQ